jgi:hypothetical protein
MTTLLLSTRNSEDNQQLWRCAVQRGWSVERARGVSIPDIEDAEVVLYMESLFALSVAEQLGLRLLQPAETWLPNLPQEYVGRRIELTTLERCRQGLFPVFVKPPNEKSFTAQVVATPEELPSDYDSSTPVLTSEPVRWGVEIRCFCLDGEVRTSSPYLRGGELSQLDGFSASDSELADATQLAERVLSDSRVSTPRAIVLDIGFMNEERWTVIEANAAWGSGIYGCDPSEVLNVVQHATEKL